MKNHETSKWVVLRPQLPAISLLNNCPYRPPTTEATSTYSFLTHGTSADSLLLSMVALRMERLFRRFHLVRCFGPFQVFKIFQFHMFIVLKNNIYVTFQASCSKISSLKFDFLAILHTPTPNCLTVAAILATRAVLEPILLGVEQKPPRTKMESRKQQSSSTFSVGDPRIILHFSHCYWAGGSSNIYYV